MPVPNPEPEANGRQTSSPSSPTAKDPPAPQQPPTTEKKKPKVRHTHSLAHLNNLVISSGMSGYTYDKDFKRSKNKTSIHLSNLEFHLTFVEFLPNHGTTRGTRACVTALFERIFAYIRVFALATALSTQRCMKTSVIALARSRPLSSLEEQSAESPNVQTVQACKM